MTKRRITFFREMLAESYVAVDIFLAVDLDIVRGVCDAALDQFRLDCCSFEWSIELR